MTGVVLWSVERDAPATDSVSGAPKERRKQFGCASSGDSVGQGLIVDLCKVEQAGTAADPGLEGRHLWQPLAS
ncbi:hypothetical protein AB0I66_00060 [Streptomyces sp. NPDC050439]|uniref:hypothetical protein n=1 Tax=unclassified Streptomyces TaxID=2593676 RepID=UPI00341C9F31